MEDATCVVVPNLYFVTTSGPPKEPTLPKLNLEFLVKRLDDYV